MTDGTGKSLEDWARIVEEMDGGPPGLSAAVGVLGWGRSGRSAAAFLRSQNRRVIVWDDSDAGRAAAKTAGFDVVDLTQDAAWEGDDAPEELIVSPGIPHLYPAPHPAVAQALKRGARLDNDVGLFFKNKPRNDIFGSSHALAPRAFTICVTGSNGKSTTTALIGHIVSTQSAWPVQVGGNIGRPVLELAKPCGVMIYVLELSSYQLELARSLDGDVGVFLNLSDDHLDRHGGRGGYFAAKARLMRQSDAHIIGVDEPEGRFLAQRVQQRGDLICSGDVRSAGDDAASYGYVAGAVTDSNGVRFDLTNAPALQGAHNAQNAAAAVAACRKLALTDAQIQAGLESFPGLPHRAERLAVVNNVLWVNDSKATNADAAEKALVTYDNVRWIAGGVPKSGGIASLAPLFDRVKKAYLIGEAAQEFAQTLGDAVPHEICGDLETAVARVAAEADPGDVALLSPACASFDQFPNFEARGDAFRALVRALTQETAP